jgi:NADH-quinone oxidoreductase subunit J
MVDVIVFVVAGLIVLAGALGVVLNRNPVRSALSLVGSFFGVAVLFVLQEAHFLALVQIVVYAGAIVVLFLFVIMLLGVDEFEDLSIEPLAGQRIGGLLAGAALFVFLLGGLFLSGDRDKGAVAVTGTESATQPIDETQPNIGRNVLAFEATALLLTIATVGAVVLVRNAGAEDLTVDEPGRADR